MLYQNITWKFFIFCSIQNLALIFYMIQIKTSIFLMEYQRVFIESIYMQKISDKFFLIQFSEEEIVVSDEIIIKDIIVKDELFLFV